MKTRVLMFGWEYPPEISGGLGIATHGLLHGLTKQGTSVKFVIPTYKKQTAKTAWEIISAGDVKMVSRSVLEEKHWEKISYIEVGAMLMPYISLDDYRKLEEKKESGITQQVRVLKETYEFGGGYGENLMEEVSRFALIGAQLASKNDFDVIHGHDWMTYPAALAAGAKSGKPVVLHVHSTEIERSLAHLAQDIYDLERKCLENADHVIAVSQLTKDILLLHYKLDESKITVVHNSFSQEFVKPVTKKKFPSKNPTITFLGRMARQKAPTLFVDVAKSLSDRNPNYRFVMAGEGYLIDEIKQKVYQMNLQERFSFPGFLSSEEVKKVFAKTDVFLMPASAEPFGMVALEAAYSGVPVVLSKQSGAIEVLPSAHKFECWQTFRMADTIDEMIHHPKKALNYAKKIQKEARKTSWDKAAKKTIGVYKKLK